MVDVVSKEKRSKMMSGIKSKNTRPEIIVRQHLHAKGYRFRLHDKNLPGKPDIVLKKYKAVIFIHGCYWHRHENCKLASTPKQNQQFWQDKFNANIRRDGEVYFQLKTQRWRAAVIWECAIRDKAKLPEYIESLAMWLEAESEYLEMPEVGLEG